MSTFLTWLVSAIATVLFMRTAFRVKWTARDTVAVVVGLVLGNLMHALLSIPVEAALAIFALFLFAHRKRRA